MKRISFSIHVIKNFRTKLGIYEEHCGLSNVLMSWGHDEYMYRVLKHNKTTIPEEGLAMIRYYAFATLWHKKKTSI